MSKLIPLSRRILAYIWASPYTLLGVTIGLLLGGQFRWFEGVIEIHSRRIANLLEGLWVPAMALTLGHVVFGHDGDALEMTRVHERVHVRQYERWGPAFVPAYLIYWWLLQRRGQDGYRENPFEIEAYEADTPQWH
ncbi:hypothetical protein K227x_11580 [Rubripirellula lacrimiformis]|uniref:Signal peptide prediction n=1 Tax=Rubripirellula lacrimiformis TaxID=1930273 RepID=A0A517N6N9_9BACT|nr:hypothetical protein [Rubripirellula lacrimiformis]QDT02780.1 hypothetical protein K227x_11580 [Rubripirellula lacrimiformis]